MTRIYTLVTCHDRALEYGSTLVFDSVRTAFPDRAAHQLVVVDQSMDKVSSRVVQEKTEAAGGIHIRQGDPVIHAEFLERVLLPLRNSDEPLVIVDPDVVFWKEFPADWAANQPAPIAGRLFPSFRFGGYTEAPRVHPSLWLIRRASEAATILMDERRRRYDYRPFHPTNIGDVHYDTGAALFATKPELFAAFEEPFLDYYDHLFLGSAIRYVKPVPPVVQKAHDLAKNGNIQGLRGIWREQEEWIREQK